MANAPFHTNKQLNRIKVDLESIMTALEGGNAKTAMARLRVPPIQDKADDKMTPLLVTCGVLIGCCVFIFILILGLVAYGGVLERLNISY